MSRNQHSKRTVSRREALGVLGMAGAALSAACGPRRPLPDHYYHGDADHSDTADSHADTADHADRDLRGVAERNHWPLPLDKPISCAAISGRTSRAFRSP